MIASMSVSGQPTAVRARIKGRLSWGTHGAEIFIRRLQSDDMLRRKRGTLQQGRAVLGPPMSRRGAQIDLLRLEATGTGVEEHSMVKPRIVSLHSSDDAPLQLSFLLLVVNAYAARRHLTGARGKVRGQDGPGFGRALPQEDVAFQLAVTVLGRAQHEIGDLALENGKVVHDLSDADCTLFVD
jgi:hypothetical protein